MIFFVSVLVLGSIPLLSIKKYLTGLLNFFIVFLRVAKTNKNMTDFTRKSKVD